MLVQATIQDQVRMFLSKQDMIMQCPNTGDDIEVRFDSQGIGVLRDDDGEVVARFEISVRSI